MIFDLEYFWIPLAVLGLVGYIILACGRFHQNTADKYVEFYGTPKGNIHHIYPPTPKGNRTPVDRAYAAFFFAEAKVMARKVAISTVAIVLLTKT